MKLRRRRLLLPKPLAPTERISRLKRELLRVAARRLPRRPLALRNRPFPATSEPTIKFRPGSWATHQFSIDPPEVAQAKNQQARERLEAMLFPPDEKVWQKYPGPSPLPPKP